MEKLIIPELKKTYLIEKEVDEIKNPEEIKNIFKKFPDASVFLVFRNNNDLRHNLCLGVETESVTYCLPGADLWTFFPFLSDTTIYPSFAPFFYIREISDKLRSCINRGLTLIHFNGAAIQPFEEPAIYPLTPKI